MFDQIFERSDALRRQLAGPLREARLAYLSYRAEQGAPRSTLRKLAQYMLVVTERLNLQSHGTVTRTQIERAAHQWTRRHVQHHKIKSGFSRKSKSCFVYIKIANRVEVNVNLQWKRVSGPPPIFQQ